MLSVHERAQLVAAARLYYESNLTQAQIAQRLNVSRPSVSKMLARARELGIVHIEIRAGDEGKADLLQRLQSKYALAGGCVLTDEQDALCIILWLKQRLTRAWLWAGVMPWARLC